jgi:GNAT superfamily N-acetyltransferase
LVALVVIVGADAFAVHCARVSRSIMVTALVVRVGEQSLARDRIVHAEPAVTPGVRVLGQRLPRGAAGLALRLDDGSVITVPTRHPQRLASVLAVAVNGVDVRVAEPDELAVLPEIEQQANELFRLTGITVPPGGVTASGLHAARAVLVAGRPPVGFAQLEELGGLAHLAELDVAAGRMRQGIGTALLESACAWARENGYRAITLTTFADVPWNAPFYAARGFVEVDELSPELAEVRDWERARGLDALGRRIAMRRTL